MAIATAEPIEEKKENEKMKKINIRSKVKYAGIEDGKVTLTLFLTPEQESALDHVYEEVDTEGCASTPTKVDKDGKLYFKATSR